jgi:hypothetical protein
VAPRCSRESYYAHEVQNYGINFNYLQLCIARGVVTVKPYKQYFLSKLITYSKLAVDFIEKFQVNQISETKNKLSTTGILKMFLLLKMFIVFDVEMFYINIMFNIHCLLVEMREHFR